MSEPAKLNFEDALEALDTIITGLESGSVPLAQSVAAFEKGTQLLSFCQKTLKEAELKVRVLEDAAREEA